MILTVLAGAMFSQVAFKEGAIVAQGPVILGQIADLSAVPESLRRRASDLVLMERPAQPAAISYQSLASRARSLMPALRPWLNKVQVGTLRLNGHYDAHPVELIAADASDMIEGANVTVVTRAGPFTIERRGTAVQDARSGESSFVRFADGTVVSAACCR